MFFALFIICFKFFVVFSIFLLIYILITQLIYIKLKYYHNSIYKNAKIFHARNDTLHHRSDFIFVIFCVHIFDGFSFSIHRNLFLFGAMLAVFFQRFGGHFPRFFVAMLGAMKEIFFQQSVHHHIGITPNRGGKMRVTCK